MIKILYYVVKFIKIFFYILNNSYINIVLHYILYILF